MFLVDPVSIAAVDGTTVELTCTANNTDTIDFRVNALSQSVRDKGFTPFPTEPLSAKQRLRGEY